jgi:peptide chain release factor 2
VLHPYKLIKDHRTKYEEHNAEAVLDGDIDAFIKSYLLYLTFNQKREDN